MISVIIPSYNQQDYLCDAIESAIGQSDDVIVIDDGSTDNSLEIARKYEPKIRVVSQVNKGLSSARNTGIMWARHPYILPLDADDILMDGALEKIWKVIEDNNWPDILAPSFKCFGKGNEEVILMNDPVLEDFKSGNRIPYFSAIKKACLLMVGGYSSRMVEGYEDLHLTINLLTRGAKIVTIPEPLVLYRTKEESMWTKAKEHHHKLLAQINKDFNVDLNF